jgi:diguanylate cyclase (GGDEF)-like protein
VERRIKQIINLVLFVAMALVAARFVLLITDPIFNPLFNPELSKPLPFYALGRSTIDMLYMAAAYVQAPLQTLLTWLLVWFPFLQSGWFPVMPAEQLAPMLLSLKATASFIPLSNELTKLPPVQWLPGFVDWVSLLCIANLIVLRPLLHALVNVFSNTVWALLTERSFSQKKEALYREELKARNEKLRQLTMQYRTLDKTNANLAQSVIQDELTGTYNKRFYIEKLNELFLRQKNNFEHFSVVMLDIDYFKKVNDNHGHLVGDEVLKAIAKTALVHMPQQSFVCRFGGEEFAVLVPGLTCDHVLYATNQLRLACPQLTFTVPDLRITLSAGVAFINFATPEAQLLTDPQQVIKLADDELYRAKLEGRNRICFMELTPHATA